MFLIMFERETEPLFRRISVGATRVLNPIHRRAVDFTVIYLFPSYISRRICRARSEFNLPAVCAAHTPESHAANYIVR